MFTNSHLWSKVTFFCRIYFWILFFFFSLLWVMHRTKAICVRSYLDLRFDSKIWNDFHSAAESSCAVIFLALNTHREHLNHKGLQQLNCRNMKGIERETVENGFSRVGKLDGFCIAQWDQLNSRGPCCAEVRPQHTLALIVHSVCAKIHKWLKFFCVYLCF